MQTPQLLTDSKPMYNASGYQDHYSTATSSTTDPTLSQTSAYNAIAGTSAHPYNLGTSLPTAQQSSSGYEQHTYSADDETGMAPTHVAALTAATSNNASQSSNDGFVYSDPHVASNGHQPSYVANGFPPQDWRQWTRTYAQMNQSGDYLNTATTLMNLGRDGVAQGPGNETSGLLDSSGVQAHVVHHWPEISFPGAANSHMGQQ